MRLVVLALVVAAIAAAAIGQTAWGWHIGPSTAARATERRTAATRTGSPRPSAPAGSSRPFPLELLDNSVVTTGLQRRLLGVLGTNGLLDAASAVCVYDLSTDQLVFARHSKTPLRPASNEKLLTSATALALWGPEHRFATDLYENGSLAANGVFRGTLYLKGFGDPTLGTAA